jgi:hypothetical protein
MKIFHITLMGGVIAGYWYGQVVRADVTPDTNPFFTISSRNMFGLLPIPTNQPAATTSMIPTATITPNGITTIFGSPQVLFKVMAAPVPGQPTTREQSYILGEGESQDGIKVQKIDVESAMVTFDNNGTIQKLRLLSATDTSETSSSTTASAGLTTRATGGYEPLWLRARRNRMQDTSQPTIPQGFSSVTQ